MYHRPIKHGGPWPLIFVSRYVSSSSFLALRVTLLSPSCRVLFKKWSFLVGLLVNLFFYLHRESVHISECVYVHVRILAHVLAAAIRPKCCTRLWRYLLADQILHAVDAPKLRSGACVQVWVIPKLQGAPRLATDGPTTLSGKRGYWSWPLQGLSTC